MADEKSMMPELTLDPSRTDAVPQLTLDPAAPAAPAPEAAKPEATPVRLDENLLNDAEKQAGPVAFSTMLKPAGSACNLDCHYCYYLDKAVQYGGRQAVMSDELL